MILPGTQVRDCALLKNTLSEKDMETLPPEETELLAWLPTTGSQNVPLGPLPR